MFWCFLLVGGYSAVSCDPCVLIRRGERTSPFKKDIHLVHGWKARGSFWGPYIEAGSSSLAYRLFFQTTWFHGLRLAWLPLGSRCHCFIVGEAWHAYLWTDTESAGPLSIQGVLMNKGHHWLTGGCLIKYQLWLPRGNPQNWPQLQPSYTDTCWKPQTNIFLPQNPWPGLWL